MQHVAELEYPLAHKKPPQDDLVELGVGPPGEEPVELDQEPEVDVLGLGLGPADLPVLVVTDVDSHGFCKEGW